MTKYNAEIVKNMINSGFKECTKNYKKSSNGAQAEKRKLMLVN